MLLLWSKRRNDTRCTQKAQTVAAKQHIAKRERKTSSIKLRTSGCDIWPAIFIWEENCCYFFSHFISQHTIFFLMYRIESCCARCRLLRARYCTYFNSSHTRYGINCRDMLLRELRDDGRQQTGELCLSLFYFTSDDDRAWIKAISHSIEAPATGLSLDSVDPSNNSSSSRQTTCRRAINTKLSWARAPKK